MVPHRMVARKQRRPRRDDEFSPANSYTFTVTAQSTANPGTYQAIIHAAASGIERTVTVTVTVQPAITSTATATKNQLTVNVVGGPSDAVSVLINPQTSDNQYDQGAAVQVTPVILISGYSFDHWELDGANVGGAQPYLIVIDTSHTLTAVFTAPQITTTTQQSTPTSPPRCIIATAAYASEMAPEVVYMRFVRDNLIGSTLTGKILRDSFNTFYYSWSPPIAQAIAGNGGLQALFRILLLPLVAIVHITAWVFASLGSEDFASAVAFAVAAVLSTCTYIVLPAVGIEQAWRRVLTLRIQRNRRQTPNCPGGRS